MGKANSEKVCQVLVTATRECQTRDWLSMREQSPCYSTKHKLQGERKGTINIMVLENHKEFGKTTDHCVNASIPLEYR